MAPQTVKQKARQYSVLWRPDGEQFIGIVFRGVVDSGATPIHFTDPMPTVEKALIAGRRWLAYHVTQ